MSQEQMEGLFEEFTQADPTFTRRYGGSGLGLAIARSLMEAMGGEITVKSRPDQGSTFTLRWRVESAEHPEKQRHRHRFDRTLFVGNHQDLTEKHTEKSIHQWVKDPDEALDFLLASPNVAKSYERLVFHESVDKKKKDQLLGMVRTIAGLCHLTWDVCANVRPEQPPTEKERGPQRVLIAEDDPLNRLLLEKTFQRLGVDCEAYGEGQVVLDRAAQEHFDLLLVDLDLPAPDGLAIIQTLRTLPSTKELKIVALTGHDDKALIDACFQAGADEQLTKPVDLKTLEDLLSEDRR